MPTSEERRDERCMHVLMLRDLLRKSTAMLDVWVSMCGHVGMSMLMIRTGAFNRPA